MEPYTVQAEYSFQGENNDELRFEKGDIITVTQREDGGWWEGTLGEKTGWFPSNYVREYKGNFRLGQIPDRWIIWSHVEPHTFQKNILSYEVSRLLALQIVILVSRK